MTATAPITSGFPLSPLQQRLWRLGERDGLATYRVELEFHAAPQVTAGDLCGALARVAGRHAILRTAFGVLPGMDLPVQSPLAQAQPVPLVERDAVPDPAGMVLQRLGGQRYRLLLSALCADAHTALLVLQEAQAQLSGAPREPQAPGEPLPFTSLAQWQHDMLAEAVGTDLPAWAEPLPSSLPFQRRDPLDGSHPRRHAVLLPAPLQQAIAGAAASLGVSAEHVLLAAWSALLRRLHGQPVPLAWLAPGRNYEEVAALPGPFARFAPLPLACDPAQPFAALARAAAAAQDEVRQVQDGIELPPPQRHPVAGFAWTEALPAAGALLQAGAPWCWSDRCALLLAGHRHGDGRLELHFDHDACLCDTSALGRLEEELLTLLQAAVRDPRQAVGDLPVLGPQERHLVLEAFQGAVVPPPAPWLAVTAQVGVALAAARGRTVIEEAGRQLDGPALAARVDAIAARLRRAGAGRGDIVGLLLPRGIDLVAGLLAIQRAGAAYLPLDTAYPQERLAFMVRDSGAALLLTSQALAAQLPSTPAFVDLLANVAIVTVEADDAGAAGASFPDLAPTDLAVLIYTSGSTGRPKGVRVPHGALANHMAWMLRELPLTADDAVLQKTAISFDASVWEIYAPLLAGARLVLAPAGAERDPEALAQVLDRHAITVLQTVPSLLRLLVQHQRFQACRTLRRLCCGGEPLDADLAQRALALGVELVNLYGPTETTIEVTAQRVAVGESGVAIGRPIANARIYVLDESGQPVPVGVRGEIHIGGAPLADGYHARPELTAERFLPDPFSNAPGARMYRSGDIGAWRADGRLDCFGRADRQVKLRGYRIELGEIEAAANAQPGVAQACALVDRDSAGIDQLLCFYSELAGSRVEPAALKEALAAALPDYMTPNWLVPVDAFPATPNGKIDTAALLRLRPSAAAGAKVPRDTIEMRLERIWADVLNIRQAGIASSFFDLGGHSLLAVRLMAEIEREFGHRLPLTSLFAAPTIAAQAAQLRGQAIRTDPVVVPIRSGRSGRSPLVLVHPTGGSVLCYRDLACGIRTERPVVALQDPGLAADAAYESVEELAATYLDRLEPLVADRRYLLAGWSSGGVIAYEIARQALGRGHEVALLCLIDSRPAAGDGAAAPPTRERLVRSVSRLIAHKGAVQCPDLDGLAFEDALERLVQLARKADFLPAEAGSPEVGRLFRVFERNVTVVSRYRAGRLPRRTLVLQATQALPEGIREAAVGAAAEPACGTGWENLCFATVRPVEADHLSMMEPPRLQAVLAALDDELAEVERLHSLDRQTLMPMLGL